MTQNLTPDQIVQRFVCARCYGDLQTDFVVNPDKTTTRIVKCRECGDAWGGAKIRRSTAERMGQRAAAELNEAKANMHDLFKPTEPRKSVAKILSDLGF